MRPWLKGQRLKLIYSHCLISFNISSKNTNKVCGGYNNDFGFTVFKKSTFQKYSHLNALGSKFDLEIK